MLRIMECVRCVQRGNGTLAPSPEPPCPPRHGRGHGGV
ncbi:MAG TPA: ribonuclease PH, partial [Stenotrophomonas sp.]|nr:ribonuclease PH [Stenotrophomonas sp.]